MHRMLFLAPVMLTAACAATEPRLILPPADLAECKAEPQAPLLPEMPWEAARTLGTALKAVEMLMPVAKERDMLTLRYVEDHARAGGNCRAKVNGLRAWMDEAR